MAGGLKVSDAMINEWYIELPAAPLEPPYPPEYLPEGAFRFIGTEERLSFKFEIITMTLTDTSRSATL